MRCIYCQEQAGLLRRVCAACGQVVAVIEKAAGAVGPGELVDLFVAEGLGRERVEAVLDAQIGERPTVRDQMISKMANSLMRGLGMPGRQTPHDVRRVRLAAQGGAGAGTWVGGEEPPDTH